MTAEVTPNTELYSDHPITGAMEALVESKYSVHPFSVDVDGTNARSVLADYLGMSKAFPYLAAGAQKSLIMDQIEANKDIPVEMEITSVVSNFLSWDETGGHDLVTNY